MTDEVITHLLPLSTLECGCMIYSYDDGTISDVNWCPTHAAAPDLLAACEAINEWCGTDAAAQAIPYEPPWYQQLHAAITAARPVPEPVEEGKE